LLVADVPLTFVFSEYINQTFMKPISIKTLFSVLFSIQATEKISDIVKYVQIEPFSEALPEQS
tara:strand:- start:2594 stop:2782 length:189 start_codon:yes stop_codon:yes gene_type:complete